MSKITIDYSKCRGDDCAECADVCPMEVLVLKGDKIEIVDPDDIETLSDILVAAVNEAIKRVEDTNSSEMAKITGSVGMPGLF